MLDYYHALSLKTYAICVTTALFIDTTHSFVFFLVDTISWKSGAFDKYIFFPLLESIF